MAKRDELGARLETILERTRGKFAERTPQAILLPRVAERREKIYEALHEKGT